ncbi:MAG TPA: hypothetical protein PK431_05965 [Chitinophagales bacterium]|nr:hypothetical protein [Chitinophagales bacterium]
MKKLTLIMMTVVAFFAACQKNTNTSDVISGSNGTSKGSISKKDLNIKEETLTSNEGGLAGYAGVFLPTTGTSNFGANYDVIATLPLYAGYNAHTINIGNVVVANDDDYVYVTYQITNSQWKLSQVHMYIGLEENIPENRYDEVLPNQFPNKVTFKRTLVSSYTFVFPTADIDDCFIVAARATVVKQNRCSSDPEFAWAQGTPFASRCRFAGYYSELCKTNTPPPPPPPPGFAPGSVVAN